MPLHDPKDVAFAGYLPEGGPLIGLSTSEGVLGWNPKTGEKVLHIADPVSKRLWITLTVLVVLLILSRLQG